jgi:CheY-like chemotaxis protein
MLTIGGSISMRRMMLLRLSNQAPVRSPFDVKTSHPSLKADRSMNKRQRSATLGTVLLVDDDGDLIEVQEILLSEMGYKVTTAMSAEEALNVLKTGKVFDMLITDVGLPGKNGRQLADEARVAQPDLPVLFVTGFADPNVLQASALPTGMRLIKKASPIEDFYSVLSEMLGNDAKQ